MDEKEYRSTYQNVNPIKCEFEKAINSRTCNCAQANRFNLADREGVSCKSKLHQEQCQILLTSLRDNARFALQLNPGEQKLPHNAEIKIQNGGILGLKKLLANATCDENNIAELINQISQQYADLAHLPYSEIMRDISAYQTRKRRKK